ncbi:hypothetical protein OROGR_021466 [Orobanche gracilis]
MELTHDSEKWIKHYSSRHRILLVGEGDFSFAASLARAFGNASNMVATSLDTQVYLDIKHPSASANVALLKEKGCSVMHDVDASTMSNQPLLSHRKFDRVVFNFPHAGFFTSECSSVQIMRHQDVVRGFLKNAYEMVSERGEVHITHKTAHPFSAWGIEKLGEEAGFVLLEKAYFCIWDYPGYWNKRGDGSRSNETFPVGECSTYKFTRNLNVDIKC